MNKSADSGENRSAWDAPQLSRTPNMMVVFAFAGAVLVAIVAAFFLFSAKVQEPGKPASPRAAPVASAAAEAPPAEPVAVEFEKLKGKWLRPDGGYVIEIKKLLPNNDLEAAYYNPNPIHVGKAKLYKERGFTKVFVELQDVNYPGSTYTLIYDAELDQLRGIYYQATQQQEYQIAFERLPPGG